VVDTVLGAVRAGGLAHKLLGSGYSRQQELEADRKGAELALAAGFESAAPLRMLRTLEAQEPRGGEWGQYFSSHPRTAERIREMEEFLQGRGL
jgi:predicted Zn-dependent protease